MNLESILFHLMLKLDKMNYQIPEPLLRILELKLGNLFKLSNLDVLQVLKEL